MSRFMADEWDKARAQKRGGGAGHVPLQFDEAETRYGCEPADNRTPEQYFERRWALTVLESVLERLRAGYVQEGNAKLFMALSSALTGSGEAQPYAQLAAEAGMSEGAVKVAVHRLRKRYRQMLRAEIARTMAAGADVDEELRQLFAVLAEG
jgi:RNA polymerase sigma-70 factor (ECF subfamily)